MRRFPPPWTLDELNDTCFIVRDATEAAPGTVIEASRLCKTAI